MSKILEASCSSSGKVTVGGIEVPDANILTEGKAASEGLLIIQGGKCFYLAKNVSDLITTLDKISAALDQVATALTSIDAKPTGGSGSAPTPVAASQVTQIQSIKAELTTLKEALK